MMLSPQHPAMQGDFQVTLCECPDFGRAPQVGASVISLREGV
jgi:hypothetical protein